MPPTEESDASLVDGLRAGQQGALAELLRRYHRASIRVALTYVGSDALAEEVAQEAWLGIVQGVERFEGRSSFKAWLFCIVANIARRRGRREARTVPFSALGDGDGDDERGPTVDPSRFQEGGRWDGHWAVPPAGMSDVPDDRLFGLEVRAFIERAIRELPALQQRVIVLRDVEGTSAEEACSILEITEANQRVLLHRARAKVRSAVESLLNEAKE
ncbi:RNA polymerase sigma factor [Sorangium sp. So ce406]|uniref:RNA polymerase sigma factor n=1 Tax=unclassified Sorangium TaxID=2621164 RepID=UPI003F5BCB2D